MKRSIIFIILFIIIIFCFFGISNLLEYGDYEVNSYAADVTLENDGSMHVTEEWVVSYPEGYTVSYRDISYKKYNPDNPLYQEAGNRAGIEVLGVTVKGADGVPLGTSRYEWKLSGERDERGEIIECPAGMSECESIFVRVPSGFEEKMHFIYEYRITGAMTKYNDAAELNWIFLDRFETKIEKYELTINVPGIAREDIMAWPRGTSGTYEVQDGKIIAKGKNLKKAELLEIRILLPAEEFDVPARNRVNRAMRDEIIRYEAELAEEMNNRITIATVLFFGTFGMLAVLLVCAYIAYVKYDKEHTPEFSGKYYRELPADYTPAEMSYLYYFRKIHDEDITATVLDLIRKKYLLLDQNQESVTKKNPDFKLIRNPEADLKELKSHERVLLDWFINTVGDGKEVTLKQVENYPKISYQHALRFQNFTKSFVASAKLEGSKHDFFEKKVAREKSKMLVAALIPGFYIFLSFVLRTVYSVNITFPLVASFAALFLYAFYIYSIDKRSVKGNEDFAKWKAFKQFLLDFGNMKDYPIPGIVVWEHYLVYATSLKIADKVMEQLEVRLPKTIDDEELVGATYLGLGYRYPTYRLWYTFGRINSSMALARQNFTQTVVAYNTKKASGFGGGGGFTGGRSFGGGGGGFRSR